MKLKTNLHLHTKDDPNDNLDYSLFDTIDRAKALEYDVIAITCHDLVVDNPEYYKYAEKKGILLIKGIEITINRTHTVILNADKSAENIKNFEDLREYKQKNPDIFVLAPHPYYVLMSLGKKLEENIDIFDGIEHSRFFSIVFNIPNKLAKRTAEKHGLPFIATSDTHSLEQISQNYTIIEAEEKSISSVFKALKNKKLENHTAPCSLVYDISPPIFRISAKLLKRKINKIKNLIN